MCVMLLGVLCVSDLQDCQPISLAQPGTQTGPLRPSAFCRAILQHPAGLCNCLTLCRSRHQASRFARCLSRSPPSNKRIRQAFVPLTAAGIEMAAKDGMDWILHIDTDELVYPGGGPEYSIQRVLAAVPADVDTMVFPNYESLPERDDVQDPFTEVGAPARLSRAHA